ncbi:MAG: sulfotransferase domain-containing protein [Pseudomonadota bacterium]
MHVVGCPRSGTTLLTELLRYAFDFAGATPHETSLFDPIPAHLSPYLTKKPADTVRIGRAFLGDEDLHVIAVLRDPRAVVSSRHKARPGQYYVGFARWLLYAQTIEAFTTHPRYLVVRYEHLLQEPDGVQRQIATFLPHLQQIRQFSRYPEGVGELHEHSQNALNGVRSFDASRINSWQGHLPRIKQEWQRNPDMPKVLIDHGYEEDDAWVEQLADVEALDGESYKDAGDPAHKRLEVMLRYWWKTRRYLKQRVVGGSVNGSVDSSTNG